MYESDNFPNEITLLSLFNAYFDCRRHKRNTLNALDFEFDFERKILELYNDLKNKTYSIGSNICFVITDPKPREVWAADFRDRIVHHLVYNAVKDRFHNRFIRDTFSCIPERGTLAACKRLNHFTRSITQNYTKKAYYLKADISNFFLSIDKNILFQELKRYVHEEWLLNLLHQIIFHDPRFNVIIKSKPELFKVLPTHKSLWNTPNHKGLPIGNLTSQFFSNVYLNILDQYVKHGLKCKYYCRYVDDFVILHEYPKQLNEWYDAIDNFLQTRLKQKLHPHKKAVNTIFSGIDFVGYAVKPNRIYIRQRTIKRAFKVVSRWKNNSDKFNQSFLKRMRATINSYLGMLQNVNGYNLRKSICCKIFTLFIHPDKNFSKLILVLKFS
ncbi:MAG: RNA-directed DNA polymerase [bacterium]